MWLALSLGRYNSVISFFNSRFPDLIAAFSASFNSFLFRLNTILTLPKQFRFHTLNSLPHLSILQMTWSWASSSSLDNHTASIISEHPRSKSHISSNLKVLENEGISKPSKVIHNGEWSEESECKWWIFEPKNFMNQSWLAENFIVAPKDNSIFILLLIKYLETNSLVYVH